MLEQVQVLLLILLGEEILSVSSLGRDMSMYRLKVEVSIEEFGPSPEFVLHIC